MLSESKLHKNALVVTVLCDCEPRWIRSVLRGAVELIARLRLLLLSRYFAVMRYRYDVCMKLGMRIGDLGNLMVVAR